MSELPAIFLKIILILIISICCLGKINAQSDLTPGYSAGPPEEMKKLESFEGEWKLDYYYIINGNAENPQWSYISSFTSNFESLYDGAFIIEKSEGYPLGETGHEGFKRWEYWAIFSYDRHNRVYRASYLDNVMGLNDIYEGRFQNNELIMSNEYTRTFSRRGIDKSIKKNRFIIKNFTEDSFEFYWQSKDLGSKDRDENDNIPWEWVMKIVYQNSKN